MAQRKQSDSVRKMRLIIFGLTLALIVAVVAVTWFTLSREAESGQLTWQATTTTTVSQTIAGEPAETTTTVTNIDVSATTNADGLPYDKHGSDRYAEWNGKYPSAEVIVKKDKDGTWSAFVNDKKVTDCTGIYCNEYGWWFIRDGEVDYNYSGIAGNEKGKWYVESGKCNFHYSGAYTPADSNVHYTIVEGNVVRES